jgi:hypothetical protein
MGRRKARVGGIDDVGAFVGGDAYAGWHERKV